MFSNCSFQELFKNSLNPIVIYKPLDAECSDFIIIDLNAASEKSEKIIREQVINKQLTHIFPGVKEFGLFDVLKRVYFTGKAELFPTNKYTDERISGWRENLVYKDNDYVIAVYLDRTAEKKLYSTEKNYNEFVNTLPQMIFEADLTGKITYVNNAGYEMFGYSDKKLSDDITIFKHISPEDLIKARKNFERLLQGAKNVSGTVYKANKINGTNFYLKIFPTIIFDEQNQPIGIRGIGIDVTQLIIIEQELNEYRGLLEKKVEERTKELKETTEKLEKIIVERERLQKQLITSERLNAVEQLYSGFSHEFNNLLTIILGNIQLLLYQSKTKKIELTSETIKTLEILERNTKRGINIVKSLLNLTIKNNEDKDYVLVEQIIDELLEFQKPQLALENISIEKNYENKKSIYCIAEQIKQVLLNIILNARQSMYDKPDGKIFIKTYNQDNKYLYISIKDTGCGIPKNIQKNIFTPFFTTKGAFNTQSDKPIKGTGLGLSVSYQIIKNHNGEISFNSKENIGTEFIIKLPFIDSNGKNNFDLNNTNLKEKRIMNNNEDYDFSKIRIMIIDDEIDITDFMSVLLETFGVKNISMYNSSAEVLQEFKANTYDIIFLDLMMPYINGKELAEKLLEIDNNVKIIFLTGKYDVSNISNFEIISKPFSINNIEDVLKKYIKSKQ